MTREELRSMFDSKCKAFDPEKFMGWEMRIRREERDQEMTREEECDGEVAVRDGR